MSRIDRLAGIVLLALACHAATAAELGDATVASYIGQPLVADIELTSLADPSSPVTVRNASMDVYRGANIAVSPALSGLTLSVQRRDGRQVLHLTTSRPIDAGYLHLFLELTEGGKQNVRGTTLWLTADPAPPPPPKPASPPLAAERPMAPRPVAPLVVAPRPAPEPEEPPVRKPVREITLGKAPPTCPQLEEQVKACSQTEYKNGLLSAQVVELEEKVRQLQLIVDGKAGAASAASAASAAVTADASAVAHAASVAAAPPAKPAIPPPPPKVVKHESEAGGFPWLLTGAVVAGLAAVGGAVFFFLKRRKGAPADDAPAAGFLRRLKGRFKRKGEAAAPAPTAPPEEPSA